MEAKRSGGDSGTAASAVEFASALTTARAIRRGDVSSLELTTRTLDRIQKLNPRLNAIVTLTAESSSVLW